MVGSKYVAVFLLIAILFESAIGGCSPEQSMSGCKIDRDKCVCGYGCKTEFRYKNRAECNSALRERNSNICYRMPCLRGTCIQIAQSPGFDCRCEGTGFYGQRCEKACPTAPVRGSSFPYECIVI